MVDHPRGDLLNKLMAAARHFFDGEITVEEAAQLVGKHPETIRRAVRKGTLPNGRANPRGHLRIRRGDLQALTAPAPAPSPRRKPGSSQINVSHKSFQSGLLVSITRSFQARFHSLRAFSRRMADSIVW